MAHRVVLRAEADLDDIWLYVAKESGSIEIANRLIDATAGVIPQTALLFGPRARLQWPAFPNRAF